jgi:hypothetical protein
MDSISIVPSSKRLSLARPRRRQARPNVVASPREGAGTEQPTRLHLPVLYGLPAYLYTVRVWESCLMIPSVQHRAPLRDTGKKSPGVVCPVCVPAPPGVFLPGVGRGFGRRADVRGVCCWWVSMVVRFVCVVCVPLCVRVFRVSRVCPGSPRCLFTGSSQDTHGTLTGNRFKNTGGAGHTRQSHEPHSTQTEPPHNQPTHRLARQNTYPNRTRRHKPPHHLPNQARWW